MERLRMSVSDLIGKTLTKISVESEYNLKNKMVFETQDGVYEMYHIEECCETVSIEDIDGYLDDLVGVPILNAEEYTNSGETNQGSETWTFYKFATVKGYVTIRWYGESNGNYSEAVSFFKLVMDRKEVVNLMTSSNNIDEWVENSEKVKASYNGSYPEWWLKEIILSGLQENKKMGWLVS